MRKALEYRFDDASSLNGHSVGNLFMAALTGPNNDLEQAIEDISHLLRVEGQVIPVTLGRADLCAELEDGSIIRGESDIDLRKVPLPRVKRIFLNPEVEDTGIEDRRAVLHKRFDLRPHLTYARTTANGFIDSALGHLARLPPTPEREALANVARYILSRDL